MRRAALATALALWSVVPAVAQDAKWVSLYSDRDAETFYDPAKLKRAGNRVTLSLRSVARERVAGSMVMKMEIDCKAQTMAMLASEQFGPDGALLRSQIVAPENIQPLPLFNAEDMEPVYKAACPKGAPLPGMSGPPNPLPRTN